MKTRYPYTKVIASLAIALGYAAAPSSAEDSLQQPSLISWFDAVDSLAVDAPPDVVGVPSDGGAFRIAALQPQATQASPNSRSLERAPTPPSRSRTTRRRGRRRSPFTIFTSTDRREAVEAAAFISLATVPFMIGDTASGSCATVSFRGAIDGNIEHPTLACSRLNISENNTALPVDRFYVSYRHFHNVSETEVFELANDLNVDRVIFGTEKTYFDGSFSLELRVPFSRELASNFAIVQNGANPALDTLPLSRRSNEFGNLSLVSKLKLLQTRNFVLSGGLAVQLPTADDVVARGDLDSVYSVIDDAVPDLGAIVDVDFNVRVQNETVNLSPFLAWLWTPTQRCFHQGFVQMDVPLNPSDADGEFAGLINPFLIPGGFLAPIAPNAVIRGKFHQQTLLRLNTNFGYRFYLDPMSDWLRAITGMIEMHYTTTLQDAKLVTTPLFQYDYLGTPLPVDLTLGNGANRVDMINLAFGNAIQIGDTTITNGYVIPMTTGSNKAFDGEYNLQLQRRY